MRLANNAGEIVIKRAYELELPEGIDFSAYPTPILDVDLIGIPAALFFPTEPEEMEKIKKLQEALTQCLGLLANIQNGNISQEKGQESIIEALKNGLLVETRTFNKRFDPQPVKIGEVPILAHDVRQVLCDLIRNIFTGIFLLTLPENLELHLSLDHYTSLPDSSSLQERLNRILSLEFETIENYSPPEGQNKNDMCANIASRFFKYFQNKSEAHYMRDGYIRAIISFIIKTGIIPKNTVEMYFVQAIDRDDFWTLSTDRIRDQILWAKAKSVFPNDEENAYKKGSVIDNLPDTRLVPSHVTTGLRELVMARITEGMIQRKRSRK